MNTNLGLIGKKLGNTQVFEEDGRVSRVTAIQTGPCVVLAKRTQEKDGYSALQLGFEAIRAKLVRKPQKKAFEKLGQEPRRILREFRLPTEVVAKYEVGQTLNATDVFRVGQFVDVQGTSKGRGFTGVMKRWHFAGGVDAHGTHEYRRHGGSICTNMTPGRTFKNLKMPGHYGAEKVTIPNLKIARVMNDESIVLVEGGVPGARDGLVLIRWAARPPRSSKQSS